MTIKEYRWANNALTLRQVPGELLALAFRTEEMERIVAFLLARHQGRNGAVATTRPANPIPPASPLQEPVTAVQAFACRHCGGDNLAVMHGPYGYYWKCGSCGGNTPIQPRCPSCGKREKVRKDGPTLYAECAECGTSRQYFQAATGTNPAS